MTPTDLHAWVRDRWQEKLDTARAATPGPWEHVEYSDPAGQPMTSEGLPSTFMGCGSVITLADAVAGGDICAPNGDLYPRSGYNPSGDMAHIAAFDPSFTVGVCEAALERLDRHVPALLGTWSVACDTCAGPVGEGWCLWPCPEVLADARVFRNRPDFPEELKTP